MPARFEGKVAVVTGAAGGIGRATCALLAAEGARILAVDVDEAALNETRTAVQRDGGAARAVPADVSDEAQIEACLQAAVDAFGGLDILFNNAGIEGPLRRLQHVGAGEFDRVLAVNARGVFLGLKHGAHALRARGGGVIINTASVAGLNGAPGLIAYAASKHAVIGMTKTAAVELARYRIRVNAVCPGFIDTRMTEDLERQLDPDDPATVRRQQIERVPWRRYGQPEEIAAAVAFLASDDAAYISGTALTVDAARTAMV